MIRKYLLYLGLFAILATSSAILIFADTNSLVSNTLMKKCGVYLFERPPIDCDNRNYLQLLKAT